MPNSPRWCPVSGSAYTYTYGVLGELVAWIVGWALGLEYGIGAAVVCVGWSGYMNGLLAANGLRHCLPRCKPAYTQAAPSTCSRS